MALEKLLAVNTRIQMMPAMKAGQTGTLNTATRMMGISGVSMARPPRTPVSCLVGLGSETGAEKANLTPLRLNSTNTRIKVAITVATSM